MEIDIISRVLHLLSTLKDVTSIEAYNVARASGIYNYEFTSDFTTSPTYYCAIVKNITFNVINIDRYIL